MKNYHKLFLLTCLVLFATLQPIMAITYLYPNGGSNPWAASGKTGTQAAADVGATLRALPASEVVWMATGTYTSTTAAITLASGVTIYGGFVGSESATTDRQLQDETGGNGVIEPWEFKYPTSITGSGASSVAYSMFSLTNVVTLDGLTIGSHTSSVSGGAFIISTARPTIQKCIIQGNSSTNGAGVYSNVAGGAYINSSLFQNNIASVNGGAINSTMKISIQQCVIRNNKATTAGGAIYLNSTADGINTTYILNNVIYNNTGNSQGGGIQASGIAGAAPMIVCNNTIVNNLTNTAQTSYAAGITGMRSGTSGKYYNNIVYNNYCTTTITNMRSSDGTSLTVDLQYSAYNGTLLNGLWASTGNITDLSAPNFVSPSTTTGYASTMTSDVKAANFAFKSTSTVLIDKGLAFSGTTPTTDILSLSRPNGTSYDIGAYEYNTTLYPVAPTALSFSSITSNSQKVSFTAPLTAPTGYLVLRRTGSGVSGTPAVGTTYTLGDSNIGSGINQVVYVGPSPWGNYDQTGFNDNTVYYYSVYSYTGSGASTNYSSALSGYRQTSLFSPAPSASSASTILSDGFTTIWSAVSGATSYKLDVNTSSAFPFNEDFQNFSLGTTSGSDGTNIASTLDSYTHVTGWSGSNLFQAGGSIRMATSTTVGYLVTPTIDLSGNGGNATLTFDVMGYTPDVNSVYQVLLSTDGGTNYTQIGSNLTVSSNSIFSSQSISISGGTVTSKIKILTVNATSGRIVIDNIKITQIDNISGYDNLSVVSTSQAVTGLSPNTVYYYRVRATGVNSTSANSTIVSTTTLPAPPISTTATSITASGFTANWTAPTQGVEAFSYSVDYGTVSNLSSGVTTVSGIASSNLSNAITGLLPNTIYYYRVKAVNATGAGDYSAILSVITLPAAPTSSAATSITASGFTANWAAPTQGAATFTYSVDYGTVSDLSSGVTTVSGITSSNLSNAITGLVPNTTYYYRIKTVNATGSGAVSDIQSVTTDVITQVSTPKNISDLTVTAGSVIDVTATGTLIFDQPTEVYTIAVEPGGKVTNSSTLNATSLTLNSNATGTATYLDNGTSNITTANVKQYLTMGRNWYVSVPITSTSRTAIDAGSVVCYKESTASWVTQTVDSTLNPMRGYIAVNPTTDGTVTFSGTLNNGSRSIVLTRTQGATKEGFNLVGNPYPSFIDWELATKSNLDATMWYRTKSATAYVFDTYNSQGHVGTGNNGTNVTRYIPPMQAFWVRVLASGDGSSTTGMLSLNNTMRLHSEVSNKLKAPTSAKTIQQVLRLQVSNAVNSDETVLFFNSNAVNTYDIYDSPKMSNGNNSVPEIFTLAGNEHLVINGMNVVPYNTEIQLGFTTGESNTFSIRASEISNFDSNTQIYIRDNLTNTQWNLTNGSTYNFASDITASDTGRFSLIFKSNSIATVVENKSDESNAILVYRNTNNQITVKYINPENESYISLYNAVGLKLDEKKMENAVTTFEKIYSAGVYFISLKKNDKEICTKLILR